MNPEILKTIREKGLLLEKEIFDVLENFNDVNMAKAFLENLEKSTGQKIITKAVLSKNFAFMKEFVSNMGGEDKEVVEKVFVKLGFSLEIQKEREILEKPKEIIERVQKEVVQTQDYQIFYSTVKNDKKLKVEDFVGNFRSRYQQIQRILMQRPELQNLVSINKIGNERKSYSIIGIVVEKRKTKNNNLIIKLEDLTGEISALVRVDKKEIFDKADELLLDDVVGIRASGSREILFVQDVVYPDALLPEKVKFDNEVLIAFLSDIHAGGK